jgi:hypothetical protein
MTFRGENMVSFDASSAIYFIIHSIHDLIDDNLDRSKEDALEITAENMKYIFTLPYHNAGQNHNIKTVNKSF